MRAAVPTALRALAIAAAVAGTPAWAQVRDFNIPSQPAPRGIPELARQADVQILVSERAARGQRTAAVRGRMSVEEAIRRLLRDTDLRIKSSDGRTYLLAPQPEVPLARAAAMAPQPDGNALPPLPAARDEEIVVTGFRWSLATALMEKKRHSAAVDMILAEDIGKFPDANLAESMQRLPGISLTRGDGGEGRNITVRGLAAEFTRVRINGMESTSQTGASDAYGGSNDSRSFDFNVFPSEIFSSLAVRKTATADVEEGSLGATIDLNTPHPLDYRSDFVLSGTARGLRNSVAERVDPRLSALISRKFADGTFGVLASASYGRRHTRDVGYSAVLALPAWVNGNFCSPLGVKPLNPAPNPVKGTDALNCSNGNPRTGSVAAWNEVQGRLGPQGQPGGGAFFPRLPRYLDSQQDAERYGGSLGFQWKPDDDTSVSLDGVYSRFDVSRADSYISGLSFARSASNNGQPMTSIRDIAINDGGSVTYGLFDGVDIRSERWIDLFSTTLKQATLEGSRRLSDTVKIHGLAGLSTSILNSPYRGWVNIDAVDTDGFSFDFRDDAIFPTIGFGIDVADPANFAYAPGLPDGTVRGTWSARQLRRTTRNRTFALDLDWEIAPLFTLRIGTQYRESDYRSTVHNLDPAKQATQQLPAGTTLADIGLQIRGLDKLLGHGAPASWVAVDHGRFREAVGYDDSWFCGIECGAPDARVRERIKSGYAMIVFRTDEVLPFTIRGDVGMRYAHSGQYSMGYIPSAAPAGAPFPVVGQRLTARRSYEDWLPSMNLAVELASDMVLRLSAARVMSRPQLAPLIPGATIDAVGRRGSITNPFLDPIRAATYDAALEWYFAPGSLLSLAYFRKDISTYIQSIDSLIPFNQLGLPESLLINSQTQPEELFIINRLANTPGGRLTGLEINAQAPLRFLPGWLGNFGILASATFVRSKIDYILQSVDGMPTLSSTADLIGLSRRTASGTFYYEDKGFSARITGNYRSGFIRTIPSGAADSDYIGNKPTFFMDFSASVGVRPGVRILFEAQNLTNEKNVQYIDSVRQDSLFALKNGRTFTLGATFRM